MINFKGVHRDYRCKVSTTKSRKIDVPVENDLLSKENIDRKKRK